MTYRQYYLQEADNVKQIYLKEDPILSEVGEFHDSMEFIFVTEGKIEAHLYNTSKVLTEGDIFFANSYESHYYKPLTERIRAIVLVLGREYSAIFREMYHGRTLETFLTDKEKNRKCIALMRQWLNESQRMYMMNVGYANLLFSCLVQSYPLIKQNNQLEHTLLKEMLRYIHEHCLEDIALQSVGKALGYSSDHCSKVFKKSLGCNFRDYLNMLRIRKADELLADKTVKMTKLEILYRCGFNSPATYYRAKNKLFGQKGEAALVARNRSDDKNNGF